MCSRFAYLGLSEAIASELDMTDLPELPARYNIAPSDEVAGIRFEKGKREFQFFKWGLVPSWSREPKASFATINARAEEVEKKPAFRDAYRHRQRLLIPLDGFFEWHHSASGKQPYFFRLKNTKTFCMAGLWELWQKNGISLFTCTILTVEANPMVARVHEKKRMPVLLSKKSEYDSWLNPQASEDMVHSLLRPMSQEEMECFPVTKKMGNVRYAGDDAVRPLSEEGDLL